MASVEDAAFELAGDVGREALSLAQRRPDRLALKSNAFDLVTSTDHEIEAHLRARIRERFPDHAILGEEQGLGSVVSEWTWVLDPIDGTLNFATGLPLAACSVALLQASDVRVGALADLATDTVFTARAGHGWRSDRPRPPLPETAPGRSRLFLDHGLEAPSPALLGTLEAFAETSPIVPRMLGSAAVALLAICLGGGCFAGVGLRLWDVAAGILLAEESGRHVKRWDEADGFLHLLAGDGETVERLEPAMLGLIAAWCEHEATRANVAPGPGRG
jgi:myo-inositol-1(or 4)-monophosphatase